MKKLFVLVVSVVLVSCGTGITLTDSPKGIVVTPPVQPIIIPTK